MCSSWEFPCKHSFKSRIARRSVSKFVNDDGNNTKAVLFILLECRKGGGLHERTKRVEKTFLMGRKIINFIKKPRSFLHEL